MQPFQYMLPQRILCPIDFSDASRAAMKMAGELSKVGHAEIMLLHVFARPSVGADALSEVLLEEATARLAGDALRRLEQWKRDAEALGAKIGKIFAFPGTPWEVIVKTAENESIQAIVMSTHGRKGFQRAFLGSVAEKVVRYAPCSVFVVRPAG